MLERIYALAPPGRRNRSGKLQLTQLSSKEAFVEISRHVYLIDVQDPAKMRSMFNKIGALAAKIPVFRLSYPRRFSQLKLVRDRLLGALPVRH
jgi:hypothetical protein